MEPTFVTAIRSPSSRLARRLPPPGRRRALVLGLLALIPLALIASFIGFALKLGALRDRHATGPAWVFPSRVYSDGVDLVPGRTLSPDYLRAALAARGYQTARPPLVRPGTYALDGARAEILLNGFHDAPDPAGHGGPERVRLRIAEGRLAALERLGGLPGALPPDTARPARLEPVLVALLLDRDRVRRSWVPLERIPRALRDAVVASEDRRFRSHLGFDLKSNLRALLTNVEAGAVRQGGSTITQQLARGLFLGRQRTFDRKVREIFLAAGLEILLSKDQILEMYLNSVYWGQDARGGVAGAAEAARFYFDAPVESLTVAQAALLAGIIPAPNAYSPFRNPRAARQRRDAVLVDMVQTGALEAAAAARVRTEPLVVHRGPPPAERFPSFTGYLREQVRAALPRATAIGGGLALMTTVDPVWQAAAERQLAAGVAEQERWRGRGAEPLQGAFVAIDPARGEVRAMVGGRDPTEGDFNRATHARRQPGSAIKAIVYTAALDPARGGAALTPASTVPDLRREFATPQGPWKPQNNEGDYHEIVTLAKALARSLNVATANVVERIGAGTVARYCERFGLGHTQAVPSVGLGTSEVTLLALTGAYGVFPAGGLWRAPSPVRAALDGRGRDLLHARPAPSRVISERTAALMTGLLEDVVIFGVGYPLRSRFGFTQGVAGKTGTTNDHNDTWFVGFTREFAAGVWVGYDTPRDLQRPAAEVALPVWAGIVRAMTQNSPPAPFPARDDLEVVWIDPFTGGRARGDCPSPMRVPFVKGSAPTAECTRDHAMDWQRIYEDQMRADSVAAARAETLGVEPEAERP